jgi:hypothetical protein
MSTVSLALRSHFFAFSPHLGGVISTLLAGSQSSICTSVRQTFWFSESRPELVAREVKVSGQDQQHTRRSLSVTGQLPPFPMRVFAMEFENSLDLLVKRSIYAHFSEKHWAPIFCGIDQHLNRQSPFRRIAFRLREFPNIIPGISQCSSRPLTGQRHGLIKRTIPGHCILRKRRRPLGDSSLPGEDSFPRYDVAPLPSLRMIVGLVL